MLGDRCLLSSGPLDLTTAGASGVINGAIFQQANFQPTGSGVIDSFVRIREKGVEYGYNTDARSYTDSVLTNGGTQTTATFDHSIKRSDVPVVFIGGKQYYQFTLDINQSAKNPLLSLDQVQIFLGSAPDLQGYAAGNLGTKIYDTANDPNYGWVKLNYNLNGGGSGKGDMLLDVPTSDFTGPNPYIYLYSHFGGQILNGTADTQNGGSANAGYEEWTILKQATPCQVQPTITTTADISTYPPNISDTAVISGGYFPSGQLVFTLTGPSGVVYTQTDTVTGVVDTTGSATYTATTTAPIIPGTYTWSVAYLGDANNLPVSDLGGPSETVVIGPIYWPPA